MEQEQREQLQNVVRGLMRVASLVHGEIFAEYFVEMPIEDIVAYTKNLAIGQELAEDGDDSMWSEEMKRVWAQFTEDQTEANAWQVLRLYMKEYCSHGEIAGSVCNYLFMHERWTDLAGVLEFFEEGFDS